MEDRLHRVAGKGEPPKRVDPVDPVDLGFAHYVSLFGVLAFWMTFFYVTVYSWMPDAIHFSPLPRFAKFLGQYVVGSMLFAVPVYLVLRYTDVREVFDWYHGRVSYDGEVSPHHSSDGHGHGHSHDGGWGDGGHGGDGGGGH